MPRISDKAIAMPESPIRRLAPFAQEAKQKGKTVFHLNIGQPDIETPKVVMDQMKNLDIDIVAYSDSAGFLSYREKLTNYYQDYDIKIDPSEILITTGASEALLFTMKTCFNPGDELIIPEPFYANYNGFAVDAGITIKPITTSIDNAFELPPIDQINDLITEKTKGIMVCNPANPMGHLYSKEDILTLKEVVKQHDLFLIADEVYREFCYDGAQPFSVMYLDGIEDNTILIDSVSKRYSMCGARVGAMITKNQEVLKNALKFAQARLSPPTFGQIASEAALETPAEYFDEVREEYANRRNLLVEGLAKIPGVKCPKPKGAFYAMAELPVDSAEKFCEWLLAEFDHNGQTVMMAPAAGFYSTPGLGEKEVRIAYVLNKNNLQKAIECLEEALKVYPGRTVDYSSQESVKS